MIQTAKLSKLRLSTSNARSAPAEALRIDELMAEVEEHGIMQNLLVAPVPRSRGMFEVIDGGRRWRALNRLAERGVIDADKYDVPIKVLKDDATKLSETSLRVFFHTLNLTPVEECRAFQHLLSESSDIDAIATRFGVTRRFIEGRLRLAELAEPIFAKFASGEMKLDMAKAYASTGSHETQMRVWKTYGAMPHYTAEAIRRVIANDMMRANDPIALLVGALAYEAAGGVVDRDLFSDECERWMQPELAHTLAAAMMETEAARIRDERGLGWIRHIAGHSVWDAARDLYKVTLPKQPMTLQEAERAEQIEARMAEIHDAMQDEDLSDEAFTAMEAEMDALGSELEALESRPAFLPPELAARVGTFLTLSQTGTMVLNETYYSETPITVTVVEPDPVAGEDEDAQDSTETDGERTRDRTSQAPTFRIEEGTPKQTNATIEKIVEPENAAPGGKALSQILSDQLAMQRRDVLGAALIANPALALDYMLFAMVDERRGTSANDGTTIRADRPQDPVSLGNMPGSRARDYLAEVHDGLDVSWAESHDQVERFEAFRVLGDEVKAAWLAYIVATSLEAKEIYSSNRQNPLHGRLASILELDVATWWRPTAENFFDRVSKGSVITLLHEVGGPALSSRHQSEKKSIISANCEKLFSGDAIVEPAVKEAALKWLPAAMCFHDPKPAVSSNDEEAADDLAGLIEDGVDKYESDAVDAGTDDVASLIGDGPDGDDTAGQQDGTDVEDGARHDNDDAAVAAEFVAAE